MAWYLKALWGMLEMVNALQVNPVCLVCRWAEQRESVYVGVGLLVE